MLFRELFKSDTKRDIPQNWGTSLWPRCTRCRPPRPPSMSRHPRQSRRTVASTPRCPRLYTAPHRAPGPPPVPLLHRVASAEGTNRRNQPRKPTEFTATLRVGVGRLIVSQKTLQPAPSRCRLFLICVYTASKIAIPKRIKTAGNSTLSHFSSASAMPGRVATNRAAHTRGATRIKKTTQ